MTGSELLEYLKKEISDEEYELIRSGDMPHIGKTNADLMLQLMGDNKISDELIDHTEVFHLKDVIYQYLAKYLSECPEAWKWVYLSCVYKTYLLKLPMHSQEWVHYSMEIIDGEEVYFCPEKTEHEDTACRYCICRRKTD